MKLTKEFLIKKLFTPEDGYHIHKILGIVVLIHYLFQFSYVFIIGEFYFTNVIIPFIILIHGLLSASSLIFHIPQKRNPAAPMIYPEFRLHSIVFGLRSVICWFLYYFDYHYIFPIIICFITMAMADVISYYYNDGNSNFNYNGDEFLEQKFIDNIADNINTAQHSATQRNTAQHSATQRNTAQHNNEKYAVFR